MKSAQQAMKKARFHLKRVVAELIVFEAFSEQRHAFTVRLFLNDFRPSGVAIFSREALMPGQLVGLFIPAPKAFYVQATVSDCWRPVLDSRVLGPDTFPFRAWLQFEFNTLDEQRAVENYFRDLQQREIRGLRI